MDKDNIAQRRGRGRGRRGRGSIEDVRGDDDWNEIAIMEEDKTPPEFPFTQQPGPTITLDSDSEPHEFYLPFTQQPGPTITLDSDSEPHEFYQLFVDDALLQMLVDGTNEYARSRIDEMSRTGKLKEKSRWRRWKDTTLDKLKKVLAVVVNMGIIQVPELEMY